MKLKSLSLLALSDVQWQESGVLELEVSTISFSELDEKEWESKMSNSGVKK